MYTYSMEPSTGISSRDRPSYQQQQTCLLTHPDRGMSMSMSWQAISRAPPQLPITRAGTARHLGLVLGFLGPLGREKPPPSRWLPDRTKIDAMCLDAVPRSRTPSAPSAPSVCPVQFRRSPCLATRDTRYSTHSCTGYVCYACYVLLTSWIQPTE